MAKQTTAAPDPEMEGEPQNAKPDRPSKLARLREFLTWKWLAIFLGASILVHGAVIILCKLSATGPKTRPAAEVSLGEFEFRADQTAPGGVSAASFALHIALLSKVDGAARHELAARAFRVQQDIEQLLRLAHSGDFDDPRLAELKRQLQEQINKSLGIRAIDEVIITNLKLECAPQEAGTVVKRAESAPRSATPSS